MDNEMWDETENQIMTPGNQITTPGNSVNQPKITFKITAERCCETITEYETGEQSWSTKCGVRRCGDQIVP